MIDVLFVFLSLSAILGALGTISFHQPSNSALSFIVTIMSMAGLYALLTATFLFMVQLIVYAGAVITLLIFIIMFLNIKEEDLVKEKGRFKTMFIGSMFLIPFNLVIYKAFSSLENKDLYVLQNEFGSMKLVGGRLFTGWILPFELVSILLLVALIGAIVLAKKGHR